MSARHRMAPAPWRVVRRGSAVVAAFVVLVVQVAAAAWLIGSTPGSAVAMAASLPTVSGATATFADGTVTVSWDAVTLDPPVAGYAVLAYPSGGGDARTPGGTCGTLVTGTSCTDTTAPAGSWDYRIAARLGSWAGPQSDPATVTTGANSIVTENQLPGTPASEWQISGAGDPSLQGYATDLSTDQGGTVTFKVDTTAAAFRIDVYRLGWYGGDGARKVATIADTATTATDQPACVHEPSTGLRDCGNWSVSATWNVPANATSGLYLARLVRSDTDGASHVPFVVRDDDGHSDLLMQTSDTTWQAYNRYGGTSLYWGDGPGTGGGADGRAYQVSYNRPFNTREATPEDWLFNTEYPMIRWLERNGYDVSYVTGVDTHRSGAELLEHEVFLSVGHDEYWSGQQRSNVEAARDQGVNLAFLSGNEIFWRTRFENGAGGSASNPRTLVAYKETHAWPDNPDPSSEWTGTWRDPRGVNLPENRLSGTIFMVNSGTSAMTVPAEDGTLRLWRNSSVAGTPGPDTFGPSLIGYEWDEDLDNGWRPAGQIRLSQTTVSPVEKVDPAYHGSIFISGSTATHHLTMHKDPQSGALVFGAGTIQWSWGLDSEHDRGSDPAVPAVQQATVNLFADMGVQPATLQGDLAPASASTDAAPPTSAITFPADGATIGAGSTVTVTGTAADTGGLVGGIEVSTDGGTTWHPATSGRTSWQYTFQAPATVGATVTIRSRATDDSLNTGAASAPVTASTTERVCDTGTPCSVFPATAPPTNDANDGQPIELGVRFRADEPGQVTGIRFYKPGPATGTYTGRLYTNTGTLLGESTATVLSGSGWQVLPLATPVDVNPATTYVASYYSASGQFAYTSGGSPGNLNTAVVNPPLTALAHGTDGPNAVYRYGMNGGFPDSLPGYPGANYWTDVTFVSVEDTTAPTETAHTPTAGATDVGLGTHVVATFSEPVAPASVTTSTFTLTGPGGPVDATATASGAEVTLVPNTVLALDTTYTATLKGGGGGITDLAGNPLAADVSWTFTTTASATFSLWGTDAPSVVTDANPYELGTRFTSSVSGMVTGVRFYKGTTNTGTHDGHLWAADGTLLASVAFTGETAQGWQTATFANPVPITAGTPYVVSYSTLTGNYAFQIDYFASQSHVSGPLTAPQSVDGARNGIYSTTPGTFPTTWYRDASYFSDVVFTPGADTTAPTVTANSPHDGATGVQPSANVTATLSEPVAAASVTGATFTLTGPGSTPVLTTVSAAGPVVTLNPDADLTEGTTYTATLVGGSGGVTDVAGNPLAADHTWTFTTTDAGQQDYTIFGTTTGGSQFNDGQPLELGVKFRSTQPGAITSVRFLKLNPAAGTFSGSLWTTSGIRVGQGSVTLAAGTTGWQVIPLDTAVPVDADTTYVASYYTPSGDYAATVGGLGSAVTNPPLTALANGAQGPNGVYAEGSGFPTLGGGANYWVDVVLSTTPLPPDTTPPTISARTPPPGATDVATTTPVTVVFSEVMDPASVTAGTVRLTGPSGDIAATRTVTGTTVTLTPTAALAYDTSYTVLVEGGAGGVADLAGNELAVDSTWSFTVRSAPVPRPDPNVGPGGPVLVVKGSSGFGGYLPEIMRAEGLNLFTVGTPAALTAGGLAPYHAVVLGETTLTGQQVTALTDWVTAGGNLVALRPDPALAPLLGLTGPSGTLAEGYVDVDTTTSPGQGIVTETMQFHGTADRYAADAGTQVVATLFSDATTATPHPAVTVRGVGTAGGTAAAFTYDLARSVVLTRQGNPAWVNQNRDGQSGPNRSNDLFYGAMAGDVQDDWVDRSKIDIPQADEQQRLLANVLTAATLDAVPLPRFWYLPRGEVAAIVMTADDHNNPYVDDRFDAAIAASPVGCSVGDWECIRSTAYLYPANPSLTDAQVAAYQAQGFEIALHPDTSCESYPRAQFASTLQSQLAGLAAAFPSVAASTTSRNHCIAWTDYTTVPEELAQQGINLDTNYYYWPGDWVNDTPGLFTGSGFAQRFATTSGDLVDVYQATTQMTDESGQSYPMTPAALMDAAINQGYFGTFVANLHTDGGNISQYHATVAAAQARGVPVISAEQLLTWTDGRNASDFGDLVWTAGTGTLTFTVTKAAGANGLQAMLPLESADGGALTGLVGPSGAVTPQTRTVKGVDYAVFTAASGSWTATYEVPAQDTTPPTVTSTNPAAGATGAATATTVTATFSEPVTGVSDSTFSLTDGGGPVLGSVSYSSATRTATFTPAAALTGGTQYTASLAAGITDAVGNPLAPTGWSFTTTAAAPPAPPVVDSLSPPVRLDPDVAIYGFEGTSLPPGLTARSTPWNPGGTATIASGNLTVDGTAVAAAAGRYGAIEAVATFGTNNFQNIGLAGDIDFNNPWFTFGIGGSNDQVYARVNGGTEIGLGAGLIGTQHTYRIEWTPSQIRWLVDGTVVYTRPEAVGGLLVPVVSDYNTGGDAVVVDSLQTEQYATSSSFTSGVFDAGVTSTWGVVDWVADLPAGTTVTVQVRSGGTATPDGSWTPFADVAKGAAPTDPAARYLQYRLLLTTTDQRVTPQVHSVTIG